MPPQAPALSHAHPASVEADRPGHPTGRPRSVEADRALIDAALSLLREDGYAALSMLGVAHRARVSPATLYRRWSSKEDLVGAALESLHTDWDCPDTGFLEGDIAAVVHALVAKFEQESGNLLPGLIGEIVRNADLRRLVQERLGAPGSSFVGEILERAVARGEIPPQDPVLACNMIAGPVFHRYLMDGAVPTDDELHALVPMIVASLKFGRPRTPAAAV